MHFPQEFSGEEETNNTVSTTIRIPYVNKNLITIRPNMDQANPSPINTTQMQELGVNHTTPAPPTYPATTLPRRQTQPVAREETQTPSLPPFVTNRKPGSTSLAEPTTVTTTEKNSSTKSPTTVKPLENYPTIYPGLAYPTSRPGWVNNNTKSPVEKANQSNSSLNDNPDSNMYNNSNTLETTTSSSRNQMLSSISTLPTLSPTTARSGADPSNRAMPQNNESTEGAEGKDSLAASYSQQNQSMPHQVFNPAQEILDDQAAEQERLRLLSITTPAPVTFNKDSDEDITSPDNENNDNDWHSLQYGILALPPGFKVPVKTGKLSYYLHSTL